MGWTGTSRWTPATELSHTVGFCYTPHMLLLPNGKLLVNWVMADRSATDPAKFDVAVGSIVEGTFLPDAQLKLSDSTLYPVTTTLGGWSHAQVDSGNAEGGTVFINATYGAGVTYDLMLARVSFTLGFNVVRHVDISDGLGQPYLRTAGVSFFNASDTSFRFHLDPTDGGTITVTKMDAALSDVSSSTFSVAAGTFPNLGGGGGYGPLISGSYVAFGSDGTSQLMARYDYGTTEVVEVWLRDTTPGLIVSEFPNTPGSFIQVSPGGAWQQVSLSGSTETIVGGLPAPETTDVNDPRQTAQGRHWSFITGPSAD